MRQRDVFLLALLVSSAKQENDLIPLLTKIDAVAFSLVNPKLTDAMPYWLDITKMPKLQTL